MDGYTDDYVAYIRKAAMEFEKTPYIAIEKRLDLTAYIPDGFGTADCVMIGEKTLHIIDLKYGKGVPVSAEDNPQLMIYALGALEAYKMLFAIDTVKISIVQPRIDNTNSSAYSVALLRDWGEDVKELANIAIKGEGEYTPGRLV